MYPKTQKAFTNSKFLCEFTKKVFNPSKYHLVAPKEQIDEKEQRGQNRETAPLTKIKIIRS